MPETEREKEQAARPRHLHALAADTQAKLKKLKHRNILTLLSVLFVLFVMFAAVILTSALFLILGAFGVFRGSDIPVVWIAVIALFSSVVLGAAISAVVSNFLLAPLNELIGVMQIVSGGDFSVRARERKQGNPLHRLVHSFNLMIDELSGIELFRQDFINTFSHEFKTPIVSIRGFARQLRDGSPTPDEQREYADIIISESDRLTDMATNILLLSKFESQSIVSSRTLFSLDEQLRRCLLLFEKQWTAKKLTLDVELQEVTFCTNEDMLSHVWINLLSNAVKFTPEGGSIRMTLAGSARNAVVTVSDSGKGMDEQTIAHIFDKFYQGDSSHSAQGNGLGLSLVQRIIELCGGTITVKSSPECGTTFTVTLPYDPLSGSANEENHETDK